MKVGGFFYIIFIIYMSFNLTKKNKLYYIICKKYILYLNFFQNILYLYYKSNKLLNMAISTRTIRAILNKKHKEEIEAKKCECNKAADKLKVKLKSWLKKEFGFGRYDFTIGIYTSCSEDTYNASEYSIHVSFFKGDQYEIGKKFMEKFGDFNFKGFECHGNCSGNYENPCCKNWLTIFIKNK